jgi:hypothetical protein
MTDTILLQRRMMADTGSESPLLLPAEQWDDTKLRHAYLPVYPKAVALCGYDGPSTWRNESQPPPNICPLCAAILPEYWDGKKWI